MIRFNLAVENNDEYVVGAIYDLTSRGFIVIELQMADIVKDSNNEKTGEAVVIMCKGHAWDYIQFRKELISKYGRREFKFNGIRTIG